MRLPVWHIADVVVYASGCPGTSSARLAATTCWASQPRGTPADLEFTPTSAWGVDDVDERIVQLDRATVDCAYVMGLAVREPTGQRGLPSLAVLSVVSPAPLG